MWDGERRGTPASCGAHNIRNRCGERYRRSDDPRPRGPRSDGTTRCPPRGATRSDRRADPNGGGRRRGHRSHRCPWLGSGHGGRRATRRAVWRAGHRHSSNSQGRLSPITGSTAHACGRSRKSYNRPYQGAWNVGPSAGSLLRHVCSGDQPSSSRDFAIEKADSSPESEHGSGRSPNAASNRSVVSTPR